MTRDSQQIIEKNHMFCLPKPDTPVWKPDTPVWKTGQSGFLGTEAMKSSDRVPDEFDIN